MTTYVIHKRNMKTNASYIWVFLCLFLSRQYLFSVLGILFFRIRTRQSSWPLPVYLPRRKLTIRCFVAVRHGAPVYRPSLALLIWHLSLILCLAGNDAEARAAGGSGFQSKPNQKDTQEPVMQQTALIKEVSRIQLVDSCAVLSGDFALDWQDVETLHRDWNTLKMPTTHLKLHPGDML